MEKESDQKPEPNNSPSRMPFLFIAFLPTVLILLVFQSEVRSPNSTLFKVVLYGVNPLVTLFASIKFFDRPETSSAEKIVGGFIVGLVIAVLNGVIGSLAGCLCAVTNH